MADQKITQLTEVTDIIDTDILAVVDDPGGTPVTKKVTVANAFKSRFVPLSDRITSTSWDGDARSTTAKTLIDLSAVFSGVPAAIKAVLIHVAARDSGSAAGTPYVLFSPNNTAGAGAFGLKLGGAPNDVIWDGQGIVPCDANGDIYYEVAASGASTLDVWLEIWGYWI